MTRRFKITEVEQHALAYYKAPGSGDSTLLLRDFLDQRTYGDLDCVELDVLTDRVKAVVQRLVDNPRGTTAATRLAKEQT